MTQAADNATENCTTTLVAKTGDDGLDSLATLRAIAAGRRGFAAAAGDPPPPAPPAPGAPKSAARLDATGLAAPEGPGEFRPTAGDAPLSATGSREAESVAAERAGAGPAGAGARGDDITISRALLENALRMRDPGRLVAPEHYGDLAYWEFVAQYAAAVVKHLRAKLPGA